jgi:hypothetical protein
MLFAEGVMTMRHADHSPADSGEAFEPAPDSGTARGAGTATEHRPLTDHEPGISPTELGDDDLFRELHSLHRTRLHTLRHGPEAALANHLRRTAELETEYLTRFPGREVDPERVTHGD